MHKRINATISRSSSSSVDDDVDDDDDNDDDGLLLIIMVNGYFIRRKAEPWMRPYQAPWKIVSYTLA